MLRQYLQKIRRHGPVGSAKIAFGRLLTRIGQPNGYLSRVNGVIHVGASAGQERHLYARYGLEVLWIEAIPSVFDDLCKAISALPKQRALNYLISDKDGAEYTLNVADNYGMSSSILEPGRHLDMWPDITFPTKLKLKSVTLDSLLANVDRYQALILDTQGSELLVLKGATQLLSKIRYVKAEVANFEAYVGCPRVDDIIRFLDGFGFRLISKHDFDESPPREQFFELLFRKQ